MHFDPLSSIEMAALLAPSWRELAYLDPGSGSILLQLLIAGILGFLVLLRTSWGRIKSFFGRGPQPEQEEDEEQSDPES
jgi:hypothetical protein